MRTLAIIVALLLTPSVWAGWPYDAVCSINVGDAGGSGTYVGKDTNGRGLVISAAHVFRGENPATITCYFPSLRKRFAARMLGNDDACDLTALLIKAPENLESVRGVAEATAQDGPFVAIGFPSYSRSVPCCKSGAFLRYEPNEYSRMTLETAGLVDSGASGGAVINRRGELVSVITGIISPSENAPMDRTFGAGGQDLIAFVGRWLKVQK